MGSICQLVQRLEKELAMVVELQLETIVQVEVQLDMEVETIVQDEESARCHK